MIKVTKEEQKAIDSLKRLAKRWPKSLWLFSASGSLHVIKKKNGERAVRKGEGMDSDYIVATINGIENDGGDW